VTLTLKTVSEGGYTETAGVLSYTKTYHITSDTSTDTAIEAVGVTGLPAIGDTLSSNPFFRVRERRIERILDGTTPAWECVVSWSTDGPDPDDAPDDPLARPATYSVGFTKISAPFTRDINGATMRNSARQVFEGITGEVAVIQFTVQRNMPAFNLVEASQYINTINSVEFVLPEGLGVIPALTAKIDAITASQATEFGVEYWNVSTTVLILPEAKYFNGGTSNDLDTDGNDDSLWDAIEPDRGTVYLDVANGNVQVNIPDGQGATLNGVTLLDGTGQVLGPTATPVYKVFKVLRRADFTAITFITG
jgi:hypothetical protein